MLLSVRTRLWGGQILSILFCKKNVNANVGIQNQFTVSWMKAGTCCPISVWILCISNLSCTVWRMNHSYFKSVYQDWIFLSCKHYFSFSPPGIRWNECIFLDTVIVKFKRKKYAALYSLKQRRHHLYRWDIPDNPCNALLYITSILNYFVSF